MTRKCKQSKRDHAVSVAPLLSSKLRKTLSGHNTVAKSEAFPLQRRTRVEIAVQYSKMGLIFLLGFRLTCPGCLLFVPIAQLFFDFTALDSEAGSLTALYSRRKVDVRCCRCGLSTDSAIHRTLCSSCPPSSTIQQPFIAVPNCYQASSAQLIGCCSTTHIS